MSQPPPNQPPGHHGGLPYYAASAMGQYAAASAASAGGSPVHGQHGQHGQHGHGSHGPMSPQRGGLAGSPHHHPPYGMPYSPHGHGGTMHAVHPMHGVRPVGAAGAAGGADNIRSPASGGGGGGGGGGTSKPSVVPVAANGDAAKAGSTAKGAASKPKTPQKAKAAKAKTPQKAKAAKKGGGGGSSSATKAKPKAAKAKAAKKAKTPQKAKAGGGSSGGSASASKKGTPGLRPGETEEDRQIRLAKRRERDRKAREKKRAEEAAAEAAEAAAKTAASPADSTPTKSPKKALLKRAADSEQSPSALPMSSPLQTPPSPSSPSTHTTESGTKVTTTTVPAPEHGEGWMCKIMDRTSKGKGKSKGKTRKDKHWYNPEGRCFKTLIEISRYKEALEDVMDGDEEEAWAVIREMRRLNKHKRDSNRGNAGDGVDDDSGSMSSPKAKKAKKTPTKGSSSASKKKKKGGGGGSAASSSKGKKPAAQANGDAPKTPSKTFAASAAAKTPGSAFTSKWSRPKYVDMIHDAIKALKDRSGSSVPAITKFMLAEYAHLKDVTPKQLKSSISTGIKSGIKAEHFIKVKGSYKINQEWVKKEKAKKRTKEAEQRKREKVRKKEAEKKKRADDAKTAKERAEKEKVRKAEAARLKKEREVEAERTRLATMTPEEKAEHEQKLAEEEERKRLKKEAERRKKEIADRIKRRRFPMDDFKLIAEDKELGLKYPPDSVAKRPYMPFVMSAVVPHESRSGRTPQPVREASTCNNIAEGSRGLISDMMQVFHFFNGDVGYARLNPDVVPPFTLTHLLYAADEIIKGNSKAARALPPLISHLCVACLRILTQSGGSKVGLIGDEEETKRFTPQEQRLRDDLMKLGDGLNVVSWPSVCVFYMDAMERFFTTDASADEDCLPGLTFDSGFFLPDGEDSDSADVADAIMDEQDGEDEEDALPEDYPGYLGGLFKPFEKLSKSDPWSLSAEDVFALLRALTDDIVSNDPGLATDLNDRGEQLYELRKKKRFADIHYKRVKTAYDAKERKQAEEAKRAEEAKKAKSDGSTEDEEKKMDVSADTKPVDSEGGAASPTKSEVDDKETSSKGDDDDKKSEKEEKKPKVGAKKWAVPKATKRELASAEKEMRKCNEAYEKGLKKLSRRTEPIGLDKHLNPIYFFHHDPERLYLEVSKAAPTSYDIDPHLTYHAKTWHTIDSKSLFDDYLKSLDERGRREYDLLDDMTETFNVRRYLFDDLAKKREIQARKRELESLQTRLANAQSKCDAEEGRRSSRLASTAIDELSKVQADIEKVTSALKGKAEPVELDYADLTGLKMLTEYERSAKKKTRELSRLGKDGGPDLQSIDLCGNLWSGDRRQGALGLVVDSMLDLEQHCENLIPWERTDLSRDEWVAGLKDAVSAWKRGNFLLLGPENEEEKEAMSSLNYPSAAELVKKLKEPLLELERRVHAITGYEMKQAALDEADKYAATHEDDEDEDQEDAAKERELITIEWKKKINRLANVPTKKTSIIRDIIIAAISIARKGHLHDVLIDLRSALMLHRPMAAGAAKQKALEVLAKYGGYDGDDDESDDEDEIDTEVDESQEQEKEVAKVETLLCGDATMIFASIKDNDDAERQEWIDGVKHCKTLSMFAALTEAFVFKASELLVEMEHAEKNLADAIKYWDGPGSNKRGTSKKSAKFNSSSEIWTEYEITEKFVWAKVHGYPWWPARVCKAKDKAIAKSLAAIGRELISFVGMEDISCVSTEDEMKPYCGETEDMEDLSQYPDDTTTHLKSSILITRRILKGRGVIKATPMKPKSRSRMDLIEEKKSG